MKKILMKNELLYFVYWMLRLPFREFYNKSGRRKSLFSILKRPKIWQQGILMGMLFSLTVFRTLSLWWFVAYLVATVAYEWTKGLWKYELRLERDNLDKMYVETNEKYLNV